MIPGIFTTLEEQAIRKGIEKGRIEVFEKIKARMLELGYPLEEINEILAIS